jgi:hypothetical protein
MNPVSELFHTISVVWYLEVTSISVYTLLRKNIDVRGWKEEQEDKGKVVFEKV